MLRDKHIVLGVTGGIAAYKAAALVSALKKRAAHVHVIMTKAACEFVAPATFRALSQNPVAVSVFDEPVAWEVNHIALAELADVFVIAPATADMIGKIACGIADDMLSTTVMAAKCPKILAPAMNTNMYENPIVTRNLHTLAEYGYAIVEPRSARLACGTVGKGAMAEPETIIWEIERALTAQDYTGRHVLVTAGPTVEPIDPVRFISNHSSGKMGYAIAEAAAKRGAAVTLVAGPTALETPRGVTLVRTDSADSMYDAVMANVAAADTVIKAAAVADYKPEEAAAQKIKKGGARTIALVPNRDILKELGANKGDKILVGFCMETENLLENAAKKLSAKNADMIVANHLFEQGAGFACDTNTVTLLSRGGAVTKLPNMPKTDVANAILDAILQLKDGEAT